MSPSAWMLYFWSQQTYEGVFELTLQEISTEKVLYKFTPATK
jgi:hypothetical protein